MGSLNPLKKPKSAPAPTPYQPSAETKELERKQSEEAREQESELAERKAMRKKKAAGRSSLLTGAATGVDEKQTTLG